MPPVPNAPQVGSDGEQCAACNVPLAADQRYCLECGARRGPARLDPVAMMRGAGDAGRPAAATVAPGAAPWDGGLGLASPAVIVAGLLALFGFGVVAGTLAGPRAADSLAADPARVVVVRMPAPATPAPAPAPATPPAPDTDTTAPAPAGDEPSAEPPEPEPEPAEPEPEPEPADSEPAIPPVKHVWVVLLADRPFASTFRNGPADHFLSMELRARGTLLTGYRAIDDATLPNGLALVSGRKPVADTQADCPTIGPGCLVGASVPTLSGGLTGAGRTWKAYVEDIGNGPPGQPATCRHPAPGEADPFAAPRPGDAYLTRRNPFVYVRSITDSPDCAASVVGMDRLGPDLADAEATPSVSFVIPSACHDGRDTPCAPDQPGGLAAADPWLRFVLEPILASKAYADDGLVVVTSDRSGVPDDRRVGALVLSRHARAGATVTRRYDHLSLLRTISEAFSVDPPGLAAGKDVRAFGADVLPGA